MNTTKQATFWHYFRVGNVERGAHYEWRDGYARITDLGVEQPWLTKREAQRAAKQAGAKAVFHDTEAEAKKAIAKAGG